MFGDSCTCLSSTGVGINGRKAPCGHDMLIGQALGLVHMLGSQVDRSVRSRASVCAKELSLVYCARAGVLG